jgi:protein ImuA
MPRDLLVTLRERVRQIERPTTAAHGVTPFGLAAIDRALPGGGLTRGALHEILGAGGDEEDGALAAAFTASIVARLAPEDGIVLWCLSRPDLYGSGLAIHGVDPARLIVVRTARDTEILWAMEEGLRASGIAAVVGEVGILPDVASRRLQLAAERSGVTAFVLRRWYSGGQATRERTLPNAAATRWRVQALPSQPIPIPPLSHRFLRFPTSFSRHPCEGGDPGAAGTAPVSLGPRFRGDDGYEVGNRSAHGIEPGIGHPHWRVELLRCRGGEPACWEVEVREGRVADATDTVSLAATLADRPAPPVDSTILPRERSRHTG